jgi:hypothetical protein
MPVETRAGTAGAAGTDSRMVDGLQVNDPAATSQQQHAQYNTQQQLQNEINQPLFGSPGAAPVRAARDAGACDSPAVAIVNTLGNLIGLGGARSQAQNQPSVLQTRSTFAPAQASMARAAEYEDLHDELARKAANSDARAKAAEAEVASMRDLLARERAVAERERALDELKRAPTQAQLDAQVAYESSDEEMQGEITLAQSRAPKKREIKIEASAVDAAADDDETLDGPCEYTIKQLSTKSIEASMTNMEPGGIANWRAFTKPKLAKCTKMWAENLDKDEATFFKMMSTNPKLRAQDEHNATMIEAMLNSKAQRVINFKDDIAERDDNERLQGSGLPPTASSGYRLWHAVVGSAACGVGAQRTDRVPSGRGINTDFYDTHMGV